MVTLACSRQTPMVFCQFCLEFFHPATDPPWCRRRFNRPVLIEMIRIVRSSGSVDFSLQAANRFFLHIHIGRDSNESRFLRMKISQAARARVYSHHFRLRRIDLSDRRHSLQTDLRKPSLLTVECPTDNTTILNAFSLSRMHRIGQRFLEVVGIRNNQFQNLFALHNHLALRFEHDFVIIGSFYGIEPLTIGLKARFTGA